MSEISETISVYGSANKMIEFLKINDLALLDKAQIEFLGGFTVVTGETGAGKSVLNTFPEDCKIIRINTDADNL